MIIQKDRDLLLASMQEDLEFWTGFKATSTDPGIRLVCDNMIEAVERNLQALNCPPAAIADLVGTDRPAVCSQYIEMPASFLYSFIRAAFWLKPQTVLLLQRSAGLYKIFKRVNGKLTLLATQAVD